MVGHHAVLGWGATRFSVGLASASGVILLGALWGWVGWWRRRLSERAWFDDSINAETKQQKWHEDERAVLYLALIVAYAVVMTAVCVYFWPNLVE
jgi:hypothetical protein